MAIFGDSIPPEYGYVLFTLLFTVFTHHIFMAVGVSKARKKYGVRYPALYAADGAPNAKEFNCVQRGHQQSLENLPQFLAMLLVVGVKYPVTAAIAGVVYNIGKILYFQGYSTGSPNARHRGAIAYFGQFTLWGAAGRWGYLLLKGSQ